MITFRSSVSTALVALGVLTFQIGAARAQTAIPIDGERIFPESLDSGADGTLYVGSIGKGSIFRALSGAAKATLWIDKSAGKISAVTGVLADAAHSALWICSSDMNRLGEPVSLKQFDLKSGALKGDYPFPENKGLCNDIAIGKDGTAYATDTPNARVFRLKPGTSTLEIWASDPRWTGIDGITFLPSGDVLVTNVRTGLLFRVELKPDGSAGAIAEVQTSRPLEGPDGLRPTGDGRFVIAENSGGRVALATLQGDKFQIDTLKEGLENPPGVTVVGNTIWAIEAKSKYRNDPNFKNADAGPFLVTPIALPPKK